MIATSRTYNQSKKIKYSILMIKLFGKKPNRDELSSGEVGV